MRYRTLLRMGESFSMQMKANNLGKNTGTSSCHGNDHNLDSLSQCFHNVLYDLFFVNLFNAVEKVCDSKTFPWYGQIKCLWTLSQFLTAQHHIQRYKESITEEDSPALLFKRWPAIAPCLGVIICFQRRGAGEIADVHREIQMDLLLTNSKVHLTKRKFKHKTKPEKVGSFCAFLYTVFLKMSSSTKPTTQPLEVTID